MKRILATILLAVGMTGPFVARLRAQSRLEAKADVPFTFIYGDSTLTSGTYLVSVANPVGVIFALTDQQGYSTVAHLGVPAEGSPDKPSLTFVCAGGQCVLAKITPPFAATAHSLSPSAIEKKLPHKLGLASMVSIKLTPRQ